MPRKKKEDASFGPRLTALRQARGLTQEHTAQIRKLATGESPVRRKNKMPYFFATLEQLVGSKAGPGMQSYIRNKLALVTLTIELQRRYEARGVSFASLHPGVIPGTRFGSDSPGLLMKIGPVIAKLLRITSSLDEAAERFVQVGTGEVEHGGFYYEGKLRQAPRQAQDLEFAASLRSTLEELAA